MNPDTLGENYRVLAADPVKAVALGSFLSIVRQEPDPNAAGVTTEEVRSALVRYGDRNGVPLDPSVACVAQALRTDGFESRQHRWRIRLP